MKTISISLIALAVFASGCSSLSSMFNSDKKSQQPLVTAHNNVTDVSLAPTPAVTPTPAPVVTPVPIPADQTVIDPVPAGQTPQQMAGKKSYVVKKGDTLWGIAKTTYGDGKQYTKIVAANPGLSPSGLHIGQQIVIP